jgi:hypothetical protein
MSNDTFFAVKSDADFPKLEEFLKSKKYNCYSMGHNDKKGHPFIGLSFDRDPDNEWSKKWTKEGIVWFKNDTLHNKVIELGIIEKFYSDNQTGEAA